MNKGNVKNLKWALMLCLLLSFTLSQAAENPFIKNDPHSWQKNIYAALFRKMNAPVKYEGVDSEDGTLETVLSQLLGNTTGIQFTCTAAGTHSASAMCSIRFGESLPVSERSCGFIDATSELTFEAQQKCVGGKCEYTVSSIEASNDG